MVSARAVARLNTLSEYCIPFVKEGGFFIPYKSEKGSDEIAAASNAIKILGGNSICSSQFYLDDDNNDLLRNFYFIRKDKCTPKKYPRKSGVPSKNPL